MPEGKKRRRYKSLTVDRVDLVDRGANYDRSTGDGSHILLVKRDSTEEPNMPAATAETVAVADVQKMIDAALTKQAETQKAERDAAIEAAVAKAKTDATAAAKAESEAETKALNERLTKAETERAAEVEKRETAEVTDVVKSWSSLSLAVETDGPLFYRIGKVATAEDNKRLREILAAANEQVRVGKLFSEAGRPGAAPSADATGNPEQQLYAKAEEIRKADPKLSEADAITAARERHPELRQKYDAWKADQVRNGR